MAHLDVGWHKGPTVKAPPGSDPLFYISEVRVNGLDADQRAVLSELETLSPDTRDGYSKRFRRYILGEPITPPSTRPAESALKAAINFGLRLNTLRTDPTERQAWERLLAIGPCIDRPVHFQMTDDGYVFAAEEGYENTRRRRRRLRELPEGWDLRCYAEARSPSRERALEAALLIMGLTGCRPCEVRTMEHETTDDDLLKLTLNCAKTAHTEVPYRTRTLSLQCSNSDYGLLVVRLVDLLDSPWVNDAVRSSNADSVSNLCARLSDSILPDLHPGVNPSCFRCLFIADLKADKVDRSQIAAAAGHISQDTMSRYGVSQQGRRGRRSYLVGIAQTSHRHAFSQDHDGQAQRLRPIT